VGAAVDNILVNYLYGSSSALASLGDPHWRGHYAQYPTMYQALKAKSYLGKAHFAQLKKLYAIAGTSDYDLKGERRDAARRSVHGSLRVSTRGSMRDAALEGGLGELVGRDGRQPRVQAGHGHRHGACRHGRVGRGPRSAPRPASRRSRSRAPTTLVSLVGRYKDDGNSNQLAVRPTKIELRKVVRRRLDDDRLAAVHADDREVLYGEAGAVGTALRGYVDGALKVSATGCKPRDG